MAPDDPLRRTDSTHDIPTTGSLSLDSDFGALGGDALGLVERRYRDRGLSHRREHYSSRRVEGDIVCTARDGDGIVGTLSVRFDGEGGLHADQLFKAELDDWRSDAARLCEFGGLAVEAQAHDPRRVLAQLFHLGYLHAHRRARCERLVIEVHPRHVPFYRRCLGLVPLSPARHNTRVEAPAVLMSIDFATVKEQISLWGGHPDRVASARSFYPLAWDEATEASLLATLA